MPFLIVLVIVLLLACGVLAYLLVRARSGAAARQQGGLFFPQTLPTGDTLARLVWRFRHIVGAELLGSRLAYLYAVLFDPDLILDYVEDPRLTTQIKADRIANNTALFLCIAAVEEAVVGRTFGDTPANTMATYLRTEFKKHDWTWPTHPLAWKQFFLLNYVDTLFEPPTEQPQGVMRRIGRKREPKSGGKRGDSEWRMGNGQ